VEVLGRYSNLADQEKRVREVLEIVPDGTPKVNVRTPKQHQHRLKPAEIRDLINNYKAGIGVLDLAELYKLNRGTVTEILNREHVERRVRGLGDRVEEAKKLYEEGLSCAKIAKRMQVNAETVRNSLKKAGLKLRGPHDKQGV
jgi:DNA-directed RNA polymerase specialized sigma24 family protein